MNVPGVGVYQQYLIQSTIYVRFNRARLVATRLKTDYTEALAWALVSSSAPDSEGAQFNSRMPYYSDSTVHVESAIWISHIYTDNIYIQYNIRIYILILIFTYYIYIPRDSKSTPSRELN